MLTINIDGTSYDIFVSVKRRARISSSEASGYLLNREYHNDVIGTYFEYQVKMVVPVGKESQYALLYDKLTDPVAYHTFVLPYNQPNGNTTITIEGRIEVVNDEFVREYTRLGVNTQEWRSITFNIVSNKPSKVPT